MTDALALPLHEQIDRALRDARARGDAFAFEVATLAAEAVAAKAHQAYGFASEADYLQARLGLSYRAVRRLLAIEDGLARLPEPERAEVRPQLVALGIHKAAIVAPALGKPETDWPALLTFAPQATEAALQEAVSGTTGARPRGPAGGDRFLFGLLRLLPEDTRAETKGVLEALMRVGETDNYCAGLLSAIRLARQALEEQHHEIIIDEESVP